VPFLPLRQVDLPQEAAHLYEEWIRTIEEELDRPDCDRNSLCRRILTEIYYPTLVGRDAADLPLATRAALAQLDPRNVTLEPEYYGDLDVERYAAVKPLIWLWEMFDKSPMGENIHLGIRFRRALAKRIFRRCGKNFKAFQFVKLTYGYNLDVGDNVVVHRFVLLDDRGGIRIGNGVSISDFANVYSHSHDIVDGREVFTPETVIEDGVRITYHATILAGIRIAEDSMVGALALATKDTEPHKVHVGIPARPVREKSEEKRANRRPATPDPLGGENGGGGGRMAP